MQAAVCPSMGGQQGKGGVFQESCSQPETEKQREEWTQKTDWRCVIMLYWFNTIMTWSSVWCFWLLSNKSFSINGISLFGFCCVYALPNRLLICDITNTFCLIHADEFYFHLTALPYGNLPAVSINQRMRDMNGCSAGFLWSVTNFGSFVPSVQSGLQNLSSMLDLAVHLGHHVKMLARTFSSSWRTSPRFVVSKTEHENIIHTFISSGLENCYALFTCLV